MLSNLISEQKNSVSHYRERQHSQGSTAYTPSLIQSALSADSWVGSKQARFLGNERPNQVQKLADELSSMAAPQGSLEERKNRVNSFALKLFSQLKRLLGNEKPGQIPKRADAFSDMAAQQGAWDEKKNQVNNFALKLFSQLKSRDELLAFVESSGCRFIDEKDYPWVGGFLKNIGAGACIVFPDSLSGVIRAPKYKIKVPGAPPEYENLLEQAEKNKHPLIFVSTEQSSLSQMLHSLMGKGALINGLKHEIYHLIQFKAGLPFTAQDIKTDYDAIQIKMNIMHKLSRLDSPDVSSEEKHEAKKIVEELYTADFPSRKIAKQNNKETVGTALRYRAFREKEAHDFFLTNKHVLEPSSLAFDMYNQSMSQFWQCFARYSRKYD